MSLGTNISRLRAEKHLSQGDLAEALGVSRQSVSKWETDSSVPDLDKLVKLSRVFGVSLDELVMGGGRTGGSPAGDVCRPGGTGGERRPDAGPEDRWCHPPLYGFFDVFATDRSG